jgi:hypothetical protein
MPAFSLPSATITAPVSVARSMTALGSNLSCAYQTASARISRPSASVFSTSMVWPDIVVTMSPGRCAFEPGMFSTSATTPTTFAFALRNAIAFIDAGDSGRAAHVALHFVHAGARLQRNAAGIERDALADKRERLRTLRTAIPFDRDERPDAKSPCATPSSAPMPSAPSSPAQECRLRTPIVSRSRRRSAKLSG